jgi:hypothetical protein
MLWSSFHPYLETKNHVVVPLPIYYSKVDTTADDPEDLEDLRHLSFKEYEGTRTVQDTISLEAIRSYTNLMKFHKVNIRKTSQDSLYRGLLG